MSWMETFAAAIGRPRAIEGEQMVVSDGLMASTVRPNQGGVYFLPVDEIIRSKGWKIYKEMLNDEQIKGCLAFKKILIAGRTWELKPGDDTPLAKEIAQFTTEQMQGIDFDKVMEETMTALEFGFSLGEIVWSRDVKPADKFPLLPGSNMVCLKKVAHRDPQQLYLKIDNHGNFVGVKQLSHGQDIDLDPNKVFLYSHNSRFGNIYGDSDLRAAYRSYWAKKFVINFWNVYLERMGSPMMLMKYPTGASDPLKEVLKGILRNLQTKTEVLVPEGVEVDLVEAKRAGNADYAASINFHNNSMARALLMSTLFGTGGEEGATRGNDAQAFLQLRILFKMADQEAQLIQRAFMSQVVKQLVQFNYGVDAPLPIFVWQDYGQFEGMKVADEIRQLHAAGIIDMDQTDVNYVRSVMGLPIRGENDEQDDVVRPQPLPPPGNGTPPPAAKQGNTNADKGGSAEGDSTGDPNA